MPPHPALAVGHTTSGAEELARRFPAARVVKAFNTIPGELLRAGPALLEERAACCLCGDDAEARRVAAALVRAASACPYIGGWRKPWSEGAGRRCRRLPPVPRRTPSAS